MLCVYERNKMMMMMMMMMNGEIVSILVFAQ